MSRRDKLVAVGSDPDGTEHAEPAETAEVAPDEMSFEDEISVEDAWEDEPPPRGSGWILPTIAMLAILGWTGFYGWANQREILAGGTPQQWSGWIVAWAVPVLLVVSLWLLAMRNSRREAGRFADAAVALSHESTRLEERLAVVNRELSLARDFIAAQSRDLESLGRIASERISEHAGRLQELIVDNGAQVEAIGRVSETARDNMERLRSDLPVISNSARDVASQIGHAGDTAHGRLEKMVEGFNRLNQFGEAGGRQVRSLREAIDEALENFETQAKQLEEIAETRFAALGEQSEAFRAELDGREVEALAALRRRADVLGEELAASHADMQRRANEEIALLRERVATASEDGRRVLAEMRGGQEDAADKWAAAIDDLQKRMTTAIEEVSRIDAYALDNARRRLAALGEEAERLDTTMSERTAVFDEHVRLRQADAERREGEAIANLQDRLETLDAHVRERQEEHLAHMSGLAERGEALAGRMAALSAEMERLAAQGGETGGALQQATASLSASLAETRAELEGNRAMVTQLTNESVRLLELVRAGAEHTREDLPRALADAAADLDRFDGRLREAHGLIGTALQKGEALAAHAAAVSREGSTSLEQFDALEARIGEANRDHAERLAELGASLAAIAERSEALAETARGSLGEALEAMAGRFAEDSAVSIERALREHADQAIEEMQEGARRASEVGREAALQLRDQLAAVNELAGNLEHRVTHARQRAEEQVDNDFARRMALITESLNSSAIDISKAFDREVTDTAWASYLRGDRGIFTRRAVRLLDSKDVREISGIYGEDAEFRDTVNHYIHDFEAMLRSVLSTRDGHALGVTLLSSDPGKLYVALAQAIDRLRG